MRTSTLYAGHHSDCCEFPVEIVSFSNGPGATTFFRCSLCMKPCGAIPVKQPKEKFRTA